MPDYLFNGFDLDESLRDRTRKAAAAVGQIPEQQFLISSDDDIVKNLAVTWRADPLVLYEDRAESEQSETQVDVSRDPMRYRPVDHSGPAYIPGTRVVVKIPFTGNLQLWKGRTNPYSSMCPVGEVRPAMKGDSGTLEISMSQPHDTKPERFKQDYDRNIVMIREYVGRSGTQIEAYNEGVGAQIRLAIDERRRRLEKHKGITALLNIPLRPKPGVPALAPIKLEKRVPPPLPIPPRTGLKPEPGITEQNFEQILSIIRHEGRTFEGAPMTFGKHDEEGLRDILLAHLNGHFLGLATGEAFRRKGKTDIRIEDETRAAFVAECKIWSGSKDIAKAIDQLLSYLTWRDSKAALIFFNKNVAGFSELPAKLHEALKVHRFFLSDLGTPEAGEYRVEMRSEEDPGRRTRVHAFLFDLYCK